MRDYFTLKRRYAVVSLLREAALMLDAGLTLWEALDIAARDCLDKETGSLLTRALEAAPEDEEGHVPVAFYLVLEDLSDLFPEFVRTVIRKHVDASSFREAAEILHQRIQFIV